MESAVWVVIIVAAVALCAVIAMLVPRIREIREEQVRAKAIDELHKARDTRAPDAPVGRDVMHKHTHV